MNSITLKAHAKLNISLNIFPKKLQDGYHAVKFLNCEIALADKIKIKKIEKPEIILQCQWRENDCYDASCPENCLVYQAAELMQNKFPKKISGVEITIRKNIPSRAGLGGGSADAAAVLRGINGLYNLRLSQKQLLKFASKISTDACYSIVGGLCKVSGTGEKIEPVRIKFPKYYLALIVPKVKKPSTGWCYKNLNEHKIGRNLEKFDSLCRGQASFHKSSKQIITRCYMLTQQAASLQNIIRHLHNDFEPLIFSRFPEVREIKEKLLAAGAENAVLAGSGLSVVGFFKERQVAQKAINAMAKKCKTFLIKII